MPPRSGLEYFIQPELKAKVVAPEQTTWDVSTLRAAGCALEPSVIAVPDGVHREIIEIPRKTGVDPLELRVFYPAGATPTPPGNIPMPPGNIPTPPIMVAPHGGGYVAGRARFDDARNADLSLRLGAVVISPDYRLAPEHPFPAAREDIVRTLAWASESHPCSTLWGFGDSAGSGLLYSGCVEYLRRGGRPVSKAVFLEPCLDPTLASSSMATFAEGPVWTRRAAEHAWAAYLDGETPEAVMPSVARVAQWLGEKGVSLPTSYVVVNPVDPLRDEGIRFACDLVDAGFECELHMWAGTFHGSLGYPVESWREMMRGIERFFNE